MNDPTNMPPLQCINSQEFTQDERRLQNEHSTRIALLEQGMESIKQQLTGINTNMNKLVWLVFTAVIIAVLKLVLIGS